MLLHRQRVLLALLANAGGRATELELVSWARWLKVESPKGGGSSFYDFVESATGTRSFALAHEAKALEAAGYLERGESVGWRLSEAGSAATKGIDPSVSREIEALRRRLRAAAGSGAVTESAVASPRGGPRAHGATRLQARLAVYTVGYEGRSVDAFVDGLLRVRVAQIVDVRRNPVSRRFGFHRSTLQRLCESVGIAYAHEPDLGIASEERRAAVEESARARLFERYERVTLGRTRERVEEVARRCTTTPTALLCMEARAIDCHRSRLARAVARVCGLEVVHLEGVDGSRGADAGADHGDDLSAPHTGAAGGRLHGGRDRAR